jgi:hypothetical protein
VFGPAPIADFDAPLVVLDLVDAEVASLREGMSSLTARIFEQLHFSGLPSSPIATIAPGHFASKIPDVDRLLDVLHRLDDGKALVVARVPEGWSICTAAVGSAIVESVHESWRSSTPAI